MTDIKTDIKENNPCAFCGNPVKSNKYETCSLSCASSLRWERLSRGTQIKILQAQAQAALRTRVAKNLRKEFEQQCKELGIVPTDAIKKLFVRARNRGYHNGYYTAYKRIRKEIT